MEIVLQFYTFRAHLNWKTYPRGRLPGHSAARANSGRAGYEPFSLSASRPHSRPTGPPSQRRGLIFPLPPWIEPTLASFSRRQSGFVQAHRPFAHPLRSILPVGLISSIFTLCFAHKIFTRMLLNNSPTITSSPLWFGEQATQHKPVAVPSKQDRKATNRSGG